MIDKIVNLSKCNFMIHAIDDKIYTVAEYIQLDESSDIRLNLLTVNYMICQVQAIYTMKYATI